MGKRKKPGERVSNLAGRWFRFIWGELMKKEDKDLSGGRSRKKKMGTVGEGCD